MKIEMIQRTNNFLSQIFWLIIGISLTFHRTDGAVCTKLRDELHKLNGIIPTSVEVRKVFIRGCGDDYDEMDRDFPFELMEEITSMQLNFQHPYELGTPADSWINYRGFDPSKLETLREKIAPVLKHKFSLRHYALKKHKSIKSNFALWAQDKIKSTMSPGYDWLYLGDTAFTFWWFCIDGIPPQNNRGFIKDAEYFDEIKLDESSLRNRGLWDVDFFASSDLMKTAPSLPGMDIHSDVPILLRGKLQHLPEIVFGYFWFTQKPAYIRIDDMRSSETDTIAIMLLNMIDAAFPGFEVKIPGTVTNTNWEKKDKKSFYNWFN